MILLELQGIPLIILDIIVLILGYSFFKWLTSDNTMLGTQNDKKSTNQERKEVKTWAECKKEAKWIINTAEKRYNQIKDISQEELDFEYQSSTDEQLHYLSESKEGEIELLAKELYKNYNKK